MVFLLTSTCGHDHKRASLTTSLDCVRHVQLLGGASEAKTSMFKLAGDVSSWWANLDPGVPKPTQASSSTTRTASDAQQVLWHCRSWHMHLHAACLGPCAEAGPGQR